MKAEFYVRGRRIIAIDTNVVKLAAPDRDEAERPDPMEVALERIGEYRRASLRDRNYQSHRFASQLHDALFELVVACTPLREQTAQQVVDMWRRADYGDDFARGLASCDRPRLRVVGDGGLDDHDCR